VAVISAGNYLHLRMQIICPRKSEHPHRDNRMLSPPQTRPILDHNPKFPISTAEAVFLSASR